MHRLGSRFVIGYSMIWWIAQTVEFGMITVLGPMLLAPGDGLLRFGWIRAVMMFGIAAFAGRTLGVLLEGALHSKARLRGSFWSWAKWSMLALVVGILVERFVVVVVSTAMVWAGVHGPVVTTGYGRVDPLPGIIGGLLGSLAFGTVLGSLQAVALEQAGYSGRRWVAANIVAWFVFAAIFGTSIVVVSGLKGPAGLPLLAWFIPGLLLGLALKRIVERQPPGDGTIEEIPRVPEADTAV